MLARAAGLSPGAVSKALRGMPGVSAATRARVRRLADSLGWQPDPLLAMQGSARRSGGRSGVTIALVPLRPDNRRTIELARQLRAEAGELGYQLQVCQPEQIGNRRVVGILADGPADHPELRNLTMPMAQIGGSGSLPCLRVTIDNLRAVRLAIAQLRGSGCKRIIAAFGTHRQPIDDDEDRLAGAYLDLPRKSIWHGRLDDLDGLRTWCAQRMPDGAVIFNSQQCACLPPGTAFVPLHVPDGRTAHSGVRQSHLACAQVALRMLDRRIRHHDDAPFTAIQRIVLKPEWVDRGSLAKTAR
jgi:DNA-binding LacI/PurR family transcriptional regulator